MKKTTIRIEDNLHKKIMKYLIDKDMSFQEYVMNLIDQDMNPKSKPIDGQMSLEDYEDERI